MQISASYAPQRAYNGSSNNNKGRNINKTVDASSHSFVQFTATTFCWFSHLPREWGTREAVHGLISSSYLCCHLYVQDEHKLSHVRTMQMAFNTWQLQRLMRIIKTATATVADCRYVHLSETSATSTSICRAFIVPDFFPQHLKSVERVCMWDRLKMPLSDCPFIACEWVKCIRLASGIRYDIQYTIYVNYAAGLTSLRSSRVPAMICIKQTLLPLIADRHLTIS